MIAVLLSAAGTYALAVALWRRTAAGILAALAQVSGPYLFHVNLYRRGDLPEALGHALVPWLLYAAWRARCAGGAQGRVAWTLAVAVAGAAQVLAHNLTALLAAMMAAVWTAYLLVGLPHRARVGAVALGGAGAPALAAFFWLPAMAEQPAVHLWLLEKNYRPWLVDPWEGTGLQTRRDRLAHDRRTRIGSPSGSTIGPGQFVDVRFLAIRHAGPDAGAGGWGRQQWLYLHPPSAVSIDVVLPQGRASWFQAGLALDPAVWDAPAGDGVRFQVEVARLDASAAGAAEAPAIVLDRYLHPREREADRRWVPVTISLSPWSGAVIRLTLRTLPAQSFEYDWAGWGTRSLWRARRRGAARRRTGSALSGSSCSVLGCGQHLRSRGRGGLGRGGSSPPSVGAAPHPCPTRPHRAAWSRRPLSRTRERGNGGHGRGVWTAAPAPTRSGGTRVAGRGAQPTAPSLPHGEGAPAMAWHYPE